jgi:YHS domain-containing protein
MEKDPVCGMSVDKHKHPDTSNYQGKTYYFCSSECKREFDQSPAQFVKKEGAA